MKLSVDLNADLGEGSGHDAELFGLISSANIESYKDDLKKLTADIQGKFKDTYLNCK